MPVMPIFILNTFPVKLYDFQRFSDRDSGHLNLFLEWHNTPAYI